MTLSEGQEQSLLFKWASYNFGVMPELRWMYHVPNGGARDIITASRLKAEGVKSGVPDICLPVARQGFHGLYIELKIKKNKPSDNQKAWLEALSEQGYKTSVCYGWEEASETLKTYLQEESQ